MKEICYIDYPFNPPTISIKSNLMIIEAAYDIFSQLVEHNYIFSFFRINNFYFIGELIVQLSTNHYTLSVKKLTKREYERYSETFGFVQVRRKRDEWYHVHIDIEYRPITGKYYDDLLKYDLEINVDG